MTRPASHNNILVNGQSTDSVSIYDRALQYGDGVFETIAVICGEPLLLEKHLSRLSSGVKLLKFPSQDIEFIKKELLEFSCDIEQGIIKLILSRGAGGRGYALPSESSPSRILIQYPWPQYPKNIISKGAVIRICDIKLSKQPFLDGLKHLNRLEQVLARSEWDDKNIFEGLLLDQDDKIIECTMTNIFFIKDNMLLTPTLDASGVKGVLREVVLEQATQLGYKPIESSLSINDIEEMEECFITNSIIGVCPVNQLSNIHFKHMVQSKKIREHLIQQNMIVNL